MSMKLSSRLCGLFGSGTFVLISYTGFFSTLSPWDALSWGIEGQPLAVSYTKFMQSLFLASMGAFIAGYIGYVMGNILSHPKGKKPVKKKRVARPLPPTGSEEATQGEVVEAIPTENNLVEGTSEITEAQPSTPSELP